MTSQEKQRFPRYATAVSTFASGYLLSKLDRLLERFLDLQVLLDPVSAFRLLEAFPSLLSSSS